MKFHTLLAARLSAFALTVCASNLRAADAPSRKPNIVIFIADDLSWHDVACFGGPTDAKTPHLDQLAREGMKLTGFYSPAAVCSPLRQALLTGMYPVRSGAYPNHAAVRDGVRSLPHHLRPLGYRTACLGKTHFDPPASYPFDVIEITRPVESIVPASAKKGGFSNLLVNAPVLQSWRKKGQQGDAFATEQAARYIKRPALELYDLRTDPWELTNVAGRPGNAATITRLRAQLDAWMKQQGDDGDKTEREATEHQAGSRSTAKSKK